ncbi:peptidoglycan hydrolase-like protein with peptidoglycan-binding domain [Virgibacillus natechei]|uniref:Autolysin n=1 Tax=Virgibacillus natechei TaxID=1216297 RepID=A0ABS4IKY3_9BACI|nr:peptidoglycan-binding protein [Virgibacillus natechei]MBP1971565.1 peptidoglycan hydrolase-like protein with peptidoglycan-binding domain [Virgibacillus natechei]
MVKTQDVRNQMPGGNSKRNVSQIKNIARHHSATTAGTAQSFADYHVNHHGWGTSGYHEVILRDGTVQIAYDDNVVTNGVGGHNTPTYHICVVGSGSFTDKQEEAFEERARDAMSRFGLSASDVLGHNEFSNTGGYSHSSNACPGINMNTVRGWLGDPSPKQKVKSSTTTWYLSSGDRGSEVKDMQQDLINLGYDLGSYGADGVYGNDTKKAVTQYQRDNNLQVDGIYGVESRGAMSSARSVGSSSNLPNETYWVKSPIFNGSGVRAVQEALASIYFYPEKGAKNNGVDGWYGNKTADAVRRYQSTKSNLVTDGDYGPKTKAELEKDI